MIQKCGQLKLAKNKKVIKFDESEKDWDVVSKEVEALDLTGLGIVPKAKVLVTFDGGGIVTAISLATVTPERPPTSTDAPPSNTSNYSAPNTMNNSIERQVCVKGSVEIVKTLIDKGSSDANSIVKIKNLLKDITKTCIESLNQ